ncbi:DUF3892 domain-containing protein [Pseudomonas sp. PDM10]|uniref:DUF3892 domain-containing protein n=1 Tax=Pseudomonas sp. PDM10 TaxID=2769269 RepID=UPI001786FCBA|nr:DUF3892 domain-containing protein [Pseudomonas sp. PDM10]MBD9599223.1 DUF3892 domain-containing protein [Pseudomonas sp. PDM10]
MANFYISAIRKDSTHTHIQQVKVHKVNGDQHGQGLTTDREFVANLISLGKTVFRTMTKNATTSKWTVGAEVHVIDGVFITTDPNKVTKDNLGNLPTF